MEQKLPALSAPEKIRLIPDRFKIRNVGRTNDAQLFWIDSQLDSDGRSTRDFVCTFIFDADGNLIQHSIELIGVRGNYAGGKVGESINRHLSALGGRTITDIRIRLFSVESTGALFGLIAREAAPGRWRVEFMPGNTLSFYPPWEAGGYDT